jgi:hypothetical protein
VVEYDAGKPPRLIPGSPRQPELLEIKSFRADLANEILHAGGVEEAVAILEELVKHVDRESATDEERIVDYQILADLAYGLMRLWRLEPALAVLSRLPLNTRRLDEPRRRALGLRALVHARLGERFYAEQDRDRLYAHDALHPLLAEIDRELSVGVEATTHPVRAGSQGETRGSVR